MASLFHTVDNIVWKGENAGYQHFLLFPSRFLKSCFLGSEKSGFCDKQIKKTAGKRENVAYRHFLLFLQCISPSKKGEVITSATITLSYADAFNFACSKICYEVKN